MHLWADSHRARRNRLRQIWSTLCLSRGTIDPPCHNLGPDRPNASYLDPMQLDNVLIKLPCNFWQTLRPYPPTTCVRLRPPTCLAPEVSFVGRHARRASATTSGPNRSALAALHAQHVRARHVSSSERSASVAKMADQARPGQSTQSQLNNELIEPT